MRPRRRPTTPLTLSTLLAILVIATACAPAASGGSPDGGVPSAGNEPSQAAEASQAGGEPTPGTSLTSCELVTPADIEAALSLDPGTVSAGAFEETPGILDPAANECRYEDDTWGGLVVAVTPTDGVNTYDALVSVYSDQAEAIDIGDGALWFPDDDRGYFLQGSVLVRLQFTHLIDGTPFRDPTVEIGEAAVGKI